MSTDLPTPRTSPNAGLVNTMRAYYNQRLGDRAAELEALIRFEQDRNRDLANQQPEEQP